MVGDRLQRADRNRSHPRGGRRGRRLRWL